MVFKIKIRAQTLGLNRFMPGQCGNNYKGCFEKGQEFQPSIIAGRWKGAVKPGEVLNPWGCKGKPKRKMWRGQLAGSRDASMEKKREKIEDRKALILEARELQELARTNASAAMKRLVKIIQSDNAPEAAQIAAAQVILDRGYGKASQTNINASINTDGKTAEIDSSELDNRITKALERVEAITRGAVKAPAGKKRPVDLRKCN